MYVRDESLSNDWREVWWCSLEKVWHFELSKELILRYIRTDHFTCRWRHNNYVISYCYLRRKDSLEIYKYINLTIYVVILFQNLSNNVTQPLRFLRCGEMINAHQCSYHILLGFMGIYIFIINIHCKTCIMPNTDLYFYIWTIKLIIYFRYLYFAAIYIKLANNAMDYTELVVFVKLETA